MQVQTPDIRDENSIQQEYRDMAAVKAARKSSSKRAPGTSGRYSYTAYRFFLKPTPGQEACLRQNIGAARWMYNRLKADDEEHYRIMGFSVKGNTPADYKDVPGLEWLRDADSLALANAQLAYERAKKDWLSGAKGRPRFKKKGSGTESYTTSRVGSNIVLDELGLKLPKVPGRIKLRMHRAVQPGGTLKSCTVAHEPDGKWYASILIEYPKEEPVLPPGIEEFLRTGDISAIRHTGLDMSLPNLYVDADGNTPQYELEGAVITFTKAYRALEEKIAKAQRKLSGMVKGSRNYERQKVRIAKLHARAKHVRCDFLHQMSARLTKGYDVISIEDLDMSGMKRALRLGKSVSDNGWGMFVRLLEEKAARNGAVIQRVDRWFPSSRICSVCGHVHKDLKLGNRTYVCSVCGNVMDRDEQAAGNIDREGLRLVIGALPAAYCTGDTDNNTINTIPTAGTAGLGCHNYGEHAEPGTFVPGNMPETVTRVCSNKRKGRTIVQPRKLGYSIAE